MKNHFVPLLLAVGIFGAVSTTVASAPLTHTVPHISLATEATSSTSTTLTISIAHNTQALNILELELQLDPARFNWQSATITSALCLPEFTIENTYDAESGVWYLACGTYIPFTADSAVLGTIVVEHAAGTVGMIDFGERTHLYQHDGYGTRLTPTTLPVEIGPMALVS